ncbi:MAG: RNA 2'-phosphotransferase [Planctomycetota bacterium]
MDRTERIRLSKFMSLVLRHRPELLGVELDAGGWVDADTLLAACGENGRSASRSDIEHVVANCEKQRFAWSDCGQRIRASQGHSTQVELGYEAVSPPDTLFHGTSRQRLDSIVRQGLCRMKRHHVHLSEDQETARRVGCRHGEAVVLTVRAAEMHADGHAFFVSANRVWLVEHVPAAFLVVPDPTSN